MNKRPPRNGEVIEKKQNTLLVDGNALFKFGYFGAKNQYNHHGQHIGGLYSFLTILRKMLTDDMYHKVYVFWDGNLSGKLRYEFYQPYKSDRGKDFINGTHPVDESELVQRMVIWEYLNEMYVRQLKHEIVETDDFIAYYCLNKKPNENITIVSTDRDFCQLISEDIRIYFLDLKLYVDLSNFKETFEYHQGNSLLIKSVIGDNSDSIKGIKGIKIKTLLNNFPELKTEVLGLDDLIELANKKQEERLSNKKPKLKVFENIVNRVTDGVQKNRIYEVNEKLMDLKKPLITEDAIDELNDLINGSLNNTDRDLKNVLKMMERDGLDKIIGEYRYPEYLLPFKKLISRE